MNKNLLLLLGAGGVFWYIRNQQAEKKVSTSTGSALATGGANYVPTAPVATNTPTASNPFSNISNLITNGTALVQTGAGAFNTIKDALHIKSDYPADLPDSGAGNGNGIWAGPRSQDYETA